MPEGRVEPDRRAGPARRMVKLGSDGADHWFVTVDVLGATRSGSERVLRRDQAPAARRIAEVDGLRALAILAVMAYHFDLPVPGGFLGVDLFFVISGCVITRNLIAMLGGDGTNILDRRSARQALAGFYGRRAARLVPAAAVMLTVTSVLAWRFGHGFGNGRRTLAHALAALGGLANWFVVSRPDLPGESSRPLLHTWSLSIEEQFYLVLPLALLLGRRQVRKSAYVAAAAGTTVAAVATVLVTKPAVAFFATPNRIAALALGVAVGAWSPRIEMTAEDHASRWLGTLLVALVPALLLVHWDDPWVYRGVFLALAFVFAAIVGCAVRGGAGVVMDLLRSPPAQWVGSRSYSLYLWHFPLALLFYSVPVAPRLVLRCTLSIVLAELSYRLIERPLLRRRQSLGRGWSLLPVGLVATGGLSFLVAGAR